MKDEEKYLEDEMEKFGDRWPYPASFDGYDKDWVDELAEECAKHFYELGKTKQKEQDEKEQADLFTIVALDAAQRAKEQMMKEAIKAIISQCPGSNEIILHNPSTVHSWEFPWKFTAKGLKKGDKVRIIIVKEDEK